MKGDYWNNMLTEIQIRNVALVGSIFGLVVLFIVSSTMDFDDQLIDSIHNGSEDGSVSLRGIVLDVRSTNKSTSFVLSQLDTLDVVVFDAMELYRGDYVRVIGDVQNESVVFAQKVYLE